MNKDSIFCQIPFDGKDIFEVGCGYGKYTLENFKNAKSIFAIDTDRDAIEHLQKSWPISTEKGPFTFQEGNIVEINLRGKEFDIAVFSNSF